MMRSKTKRRLAYAAMAAGLGAAAAAVHLATVPGSDGDADRKSGYVAAAPDEPVAGYFGVEEERPAAEYPAMSPDGSSLVFVSNLDGSRDLWISGADGTNPAPLTPWPDSDEKHPAWAPDGSHIVFSSSLGSTHHHIWVVDPDGLNATQLTFDEAEHESPRFSPDGSLILFISNSTGKKEIWVMNADGSGQRPIALISRLVSDAVWSPSGDQVAYVGCRRGGPCNLFRTDVDGSNAFQITDGDFQDWGPDWGTPGIIFASDRGGMQGLWLVQADGSGLAQVTTADETADLDPRWVGDTGAFVFSRAGISSSDAASDIWSVAMVGDVPERLTFLKSTLVVSVDVQPGSDRNSINPRSNGVIPVAILSTSSFDATTVDPLTVLFGPNGAAEAHDRGHLEDANGDGVGDLVLHFNTQDSGIACGDALVSLLGATFDGQEIEGSDVIVTVGCN